MLRLLFLMFFFAVFSTENGKGVGLFFNVCNSVWSSNLMLKERYVIHKKLCSNNLNSYIWMIFPLLFDCFVTYYQDDATGEGSGSRLLYWFSSLFLLQFWRARAYISVTSIFQRSCTRHLIESSASFNLIPQCLLPLCPSCPVLFLLLISWLSQNRIELSPTNYLHNICHKEHSCTGSHLQYYMGDRYILTLQKRVISADKKLPQQIKNLPQ